MDRVAVFVDAGYLFAQGSVLVTGEKLHRGELHLDHDKVITTLSDLATQVSSLPLLRIYWYDGSSSGPSTQQLALAFRSHVKLRLGYVNQHGQQEGVDALIVTDLINLARNRAMADAVVLTGDGDLRVGIQQAQEHGVRVHLLGIEPARDNQSPALVQEADSVHELRKEVLSTFLQRAQSHFSAAAPAVGGDSPLVAAAEMIAGQLSDDEVDAILRESSGGSVPMEVDRRLLVEGSRRTGEPLSPHDKRLVRETFLATCRARRPV